MSCSSEEIERKRLAALQKRQSKISGQNSTPQFGSPAKFYGNQLLDSPSTNTSRRLPGPLKTVTSNTPRGYHPYAKPNSQVELNNIPVGKVVCGTVYLVSEERFEVNPSEFCTPLINIFKSLPSKNYDSKSKLWNFSIDDYDALMLKVAPLTPHIVLGPLPGYVLKVLRENTMDPNNIDLSPVESTLRHALMPFQEDGVRFAIAHRGRCMIADDMGLGKTFQALAVASYYRHNWPLLIVTTSSMRETWQSKIHELLPSVPLMNIVTLSNSKDSQLVADRQTEVVIVSYKITTMHTELLKKKKFGVVIIDESHYLKSHKAQCTVALGGITRQCARCVLLSGTPALSRPAELYTQLALIEPGLFGSYTEYVQCTVALGGITRQCARCVLLSGTPALSRPAELYTQLALIEPGLFGSYTEYGKRYCAGKQTNFGWDMTGQSNLTELQLLLQKRFLIRRTKEQVLTNLEGKTRETVLLDHTLLQFSKEDEQGLSQMAETYKSTRASDRHAALLTFFSESARAKIPAICKYIRQLLNEESTGKFLVFAHHKNVIEAICTTLDEAEVHYICITGATPTHTRAELVDKFQHRAACRCAVLSITAASSGLTLTAAQLVLFAELHWNPGILTQAEARAHRLGQAGVVCARYLLAARTADDYMWPMLQEKLNVLNNVGLSKDTFQDTTMKHQESNYSMAQYLAPQYTKNKNDYIPGTNIRKNTIKDCAAKSNGETSFGEFSESFLDNCEVLEKSFLDDNEGDELLANIDL